MTTLPATAAFWLLIAAAPTAIFVIWDDLVHLKIRNIAVIITFLSFVVVGGLTLPWATFLWQIAIAGLVLLLGVALFSIGLIPGGDAKYLAAISPYFFWSDWGTLAGMYISATLATLLLRWLAIRFQLPSSTPHWAVWDGSKRVPLGIPLALVLMLYLGVSIAGKVPS